MNRAQTSLELILVAAVIITVAVLSFKVYSTQAFFTTADVVVRGQADYSLAKSKFSSPECAHAVLLQVYPTVADNTRSYEIFTTSPLCNDGPFDMPDMESKVSSALGCRYDSEGACKSFDYTVQPGE